MIWFACQQCGKRQGRPAGEAGTLIFCDCGTSNRVPWESTGPEEPASEPPIPIYSVPEADETPAIPLADAPDRPPPARAARPTIRTRDPAFCFNHPETPKQQTCADCAESFCDDCVVVWQGQVLCGPCKNHRIRQSERPASLSLMALFSPILALPGGLVGFFMAAVAGQAGAPAVGFMSVIPEFAALMLGLAAIRRIENDPLVKGRPLAMIGIVAALVAGILNCLMVLIVHRARE
jgi:hypothetical protein